MTQHRCFHLTSNPRSPGCISRGLLRPINLVLRCASSRAQHTRRGSSRARAIVRSGVRSPKFGKSVCRGSASTSRLTRQAGRGWREIVVSHHSGTIEEATRLTAMDFEIAAHFDRSVAVLVLNFGEYPFLHGTLGIIRSLGRLGIPVFAVQRYPSLPSGASRYLTGRFLWGADGRNADQFLEGMARIGKILDRPTILVPADDFSAILIAENADALAPWFMFVRQPRTLPRTLANKRRLYHLCKELGVSCPPTVFPQTREELRDVAEHMQFPVFAKVTEPWLLPKGFKSVAILSQRQDLIEYYDNFSQQHPITTLMIQEMISATGSEDWIVHGYCDSQSKPIVLFTGVKLRSYPVFAGPTTLARSVRNDALQKQAIELFSAIGYRGIMDIDFRLDGRNGCFNLLD